MIVRTGGDVLVAEILVEGNYETPYAQVGYGLREFEIDVVSRKPGEGVKRAFDKNVLTQTFRTFDADGSGEIEWDEFLNIMHDMTQGSFLDRVTGWGFF